MGKAMTERMNALDKWLERIEARPMYEMLSPNRRTMVTVYTVGGKHPIGDEPARASVFMVMRYVEPGKPATGWDIFVPASGSNNVRLTLDAAAMAMGVDGCRGLIDAPTAGLALCPASVNGVPCRNFGQAAFGGRCYFHRETTEVTPNT